MCFEYIKEDIIKAFEGVELEDGIGLWEAQAIDDYEPKDIQREARKKDEKIDWQNISYDDIFYCDSSLSFMDEKGLRFHIPAFIIAEIEGKTNTGPLYNLTQTVISNPELFKLFNQSQKEAVSQFLEWCAWQEEYHYEKAHITRSLNEFWRKN
ncbi:DUF6714 family protein [Zooshikella sp. RANM57]|uniref:DUF6714 family protein n=1 Tax=Zooshikella sp. RANM57 TaxID=3425863 RepID=UPI003D6DE8FB